MSDLTARRFRGFLPVVVDVETGGFNSATDGLLEIAAVMISIDSEGGVKRGATHAWHVQPFEGARLDPASLEITGIDPFHPLRPAIPERDALARLFREVRQQLRIQRIGAEPAPQVGSEFVVQWAVAADHLRRIECLAGVQRVFG